MLQLKEQHFEGQFLKAFQNDVVVILYKADWCDYCRKIKPEYNKLDKLLFNKAVVSVVDVDDSKRLVSQNNKFLYGYKVQGYPTIVIYKNGYFVKKYEGERTANQIAAEVFRLL